MGLPPLNKLSRLVFFLGLLLPGLFVVSAALAQPPSPGPVGERRLEALGVGAAALEESRLTVIQGGQARSLTRDNLGLLQQPGTILVERRPVDPVTARLPESLAATPAEKGFKLSYNIIAFRADNQGWVRLDAWARDSTGLRFDGARGAYAGTFVVALLDRQNPADRSRLASQVPVAVSAIGAKIDPRPLLIDQLGIWQEVSIEVKEVRGESFPVVVSADPTSDGDAVHLSVLRPRVELWATPAAIIGWGIGQGTINVKLSGAEGLEGLTIPLHSSQGTLESGRVRLSQSGDGSVRLRSDRSKMTLITVPDENLISEPLAISFSGPWGFILAALTGGLAGAFVRGRGRRHWPRALAIGAISALIMALAYAVGFDWPARIMAGAGVDYAGEAAVFVLGAMGAVAGISALVPGSGK